MSMSENQFGTTLADAGDSTIRIFVQTLHKAHIWDNARQVLATYARSG